MEEEWIISRSQLREVWLDHPERSRQKMADEVGRSKSWVKKWIRRIRSAALEDQKVLYGHSRARKRPPPTVAAEVVSKILDIRDHPPSQLGRTPSPVYLSQKNDLNPAWKGGWIFTMSVLSRRIRKANNSMGSRSSIWWIMAPLWYWFGWMDTNAH